MTNTSPPVISATGLTMAYGDNLVLDSIDLTIEARETVVLLGPNGAGKTTMVEAFEGFRRPSAGTLRVLGEDPATAGDAWRARVGVVLQSWRDHPKWQVRTLLDHLGSFYRPYSTAAIPRPWPTDELLDLVGLTRDADKKVSQLSGGRRRRLDVAVGLVGRPELLFLDEPTAGFDPEARRDFHDLLASLEDIDTTILMTTHDLDEAERVASRILILAGHRIIADGSPEELRRHHAGTSEVRWRDDDGAHVHTTDDPVGFLRGRLADPLVHMDNLEVEHNSLEDTYLELVRREEHR
ncbi:ABC transporter ATP-binding protein [Arachnia propionica]|nr:ABC transporter ATP-binding protein [Arachnia propionica]MDO5082899.1 ABC transporter ATP-binding protein [Arachnia propionica]